ncbi:SDR family oxidoreductase [Clostridium sp. SHJSY1]|uniref:SDR family NAD(P)-dependent oxidoreductase n=1 Tax=Clostridium sp. SHJSY1 TaxID=2942483 RepID=UPI002874CB05|nr:SDR family oxidoreductase [Clostridium sp. SHJSY1]MDS0526016.1 SDR family oxidoreductase [Clostridium sp. SHJSY1]
MDIRFDGKTVVITGGARGIGYSCAEKMIESGAKVAIVDIVQENIDIAIRKLESKGVIKGYKLDISKASNIPSLVTKIREELGEIDILVQAAGILSSNLGTKVTEKEWDDALNINAKGSFFMMQAVVNQSMIPQSSGSIINFASIAGLRGMQEPLCSAHYSASKGAVVQITKQAAVEWGKHQIRVNAVAPGGVKTEEMKNAISKDMSSLTDNIPLKKLSEPSDIACGVCFLASDAAAMITGHILVIDGGGYALGF